jgi:predicted DNA-binding protein (MmcQ/YjbR family)
MKSGESASILEKVRSYLLKKSGATEGWPFAPEVPVYKVMSKMFALIWLRDNPPRMNLKLDPEHAEILRDVYEAVTPGYHMNKRHWSTIILDGSVPQDELFEWIDESYKLVVAALSKRKKQALANLHKHS